MKRNKKQAGGRVAKSSTTSRAYVPRAEILNPEIDLNSLTPNELNIPGVRESLRPDKNGVVNENHAKALIWMNRNHGNPTIKDLAKNPALGKLKSGKARAFYQSQINAAHVEDERDYIAELSHAEQFGIRPDRTPKNNHKSSVEGSLLENLGRYNGQFYEKTYGLPGTIEWDAHQVIEPKLHEQLNAVELDFNPEAKNIMQEILLSPPENRRMKRQSTYKKTGAKRQNGGSSSYDILAEKGEVVQDVNGQLHKINSNAASHDDPAGGIVIGGADRILSDSYSQVQSGDRRNNKREKAVKFDPQQVKELAKEFGLKTNVKKGLSPAKAFEQLKADKEKLQSKYIRKTEGDPKDKFADNSKRLNFKFASLLPSDEDMYSRVFDEQEANKSANSELFDETEMAQYGKLVRGGTQNVAKYQQMLRNAGYNITVDGAWGAKTQAAYEQFQRQAQSKIGGDTGVNDIQINWDDNLDSFDKNVDNNLWRASKVLRSIDRADAQPHVREYLTNELPAPAPSRYPQRSRTLGTTPWQKPAVQDFTTDWETPVINGASTDWHTPVVQDVEDIPLKGNQYYQWKQQQNAPTRMFGPQNRNRWFNKQYGGGIDDVSMQGYRHDSPYRGANSLLINSGSIDMSETPENLALIPMNGGEPDYMGMQVGEAWSKKPYEFDADQVLEVPMAQYGRGSVREQEYLQKMELERLRNIQGTAPIGIPYDPRNPLNRNSFVRRGPVSDMAIYDGVQNTPTPAASKGTKPDAVSADGRKMFKDKETGFFKDDRGRYWDYNNKTRRFISLDDTQTYEDATPTTESVPTSTKTRTAKGKGKRTSPGKTSPATVTKPQDIQFDWGVPQVTDDPNAPLPLDTPNTIRRDAQTKGLVQEWFPEAKAQKDAKALTVNKGSKVNQKKNKVRFDFDSPESDFVNGLQLAESAQITPALRQRVNFYAPQQQFIDPTPYLNEIASQRNSVMQNVNMNSSAGQAYMAQIDANTQRQQSQVLANIQQQNNQIDYMNQQNQTQAYNQEMLMNNQLDRQYYQETLATMEASRQQRNNALTNWANNANQRRRMMNNIKMSALVAPDFFDFNDIANVGNRNSNEVVFY